MAQPLEYRIDVQGRIDNRLADWFEGMRMESVGSENEPDATSLTGTVADQAALMGLLRKLYDRGYLLLCVNCISPGDSSGD
jgi:hypothetical protein